MSFAIQRLHELRAMHAMLPASAHDAPVGDSSIAPPPWVNPTNPDVRAARDEAERLGVLDVRFPVDNGSDVSFNLGDEFTAEERMWAELATMPSMVLLDRASRTDHAETKRRLLVLARRKPTALQTVATPFLPYPSSAEPQGRWVEGVDLNRLPGRLRGLVVEREGWTPENWARELGRKAGLCDERHSETAELYRRVVDLLRRGPNDPHRGIVV